MKSEECTYYTITVSGSLLDEALAQLNAIDHGDGGDVVISSELNTLRLIRRLSKKETAQSELSFSGSWPFSVRIKWKKLKSLLNGHDFLVRMNLRLDGKRNGIFKIDNMVTEFKFMQDQLSLPFSTNSATEKSEELQNILKERLLKIDSENSADGPLREDIIVKRYERDKELVRIIKLLRGNKCQICGYSFKMESGEEYSECHHLEHLANKGLDISANLLILCPNHHRQFHYGGVAILRHSSILLEVEIDGIKHICQLSPNSEPSL